MKNFASRKLLVVLIVLKSGSRNLHPHARPANAARRRHAAFSPATIRAKHSPGGRVSERVWGVVGDGMNERGEVMCQIFSTNLGILPLGWSSPPCGSPDASAFMGSNPARAA